MSVLVGKQAPDFTVPAVLADGQIVDEFSFSEVTKGKYALVFFYPLDFTPAQSPWKVGKKGEANAWVTFYVLLALKCRDRSHISKSL